MGYEVIGQVRRLGSISIDAPNGSAVSSSRIDVVFEVDVGGHHVNAPQEDTVAVLRFLRRRRQGASHDVFVALPFGRGANGPIEFRCP